jgi:extracellular factor (EF) 3-hydroxypalmitic acid methyl ester biosynthesis protein
MDEAGGKETLVTFQTSQGLELRGSLLRLSKYAIVFEIYSSAAVLRLSEVLDDFKILVNGQAIYSGQGVITKLIQTGVANVCEARLEEAWFNQDLVYSGLSPERLKAEFEGFFREWQKHFLIRREYRLYVSELHSFFHDLQLWLEHIELGLRSMPSGDSHQREQELAHTLGPQALSVFNVFVERFEPIATDLEPETVAAHRAYMRRLTHPLLLCAPWVYRTVTKPLGYAGDYEMVNMMFRDSLEGPSLFAKIINYCFLSQGAIVAHRNRIEFLLEKMAEEDLRKAQAGSGLRVLSIGCGPAIEVQRFLKNRLSRNALSFDLLDFNDETLQYAGNAVESVARRNGHSPVGLKLIRKSVAGLLKDSARAAPVNPGSQYDLIYCAGLFDYLTDSVCRRVLNLAFNSLAPDGLLVATNVTVANPSRYGMEHMLDWNLVYRDAAGMRALQPGEDPEMVEVKTDLTGVNIWLEVRKPKHD